MGSTSSHGSRVHGPPSASGGREQGGQRKSAVPQAEVTQDLFHTLALVKHRDQPHGLLAAGAEPAALAREGELMSNHYHLLLETPAGNLVAGMQWLQSTYTARFNARERMGGHVFQGGHL
jgi:hypothetical protein